MAHVTVFQRRMRAEYALACERATQFREARRSRSGSNAGAFLGWKIVTVTGERHRRNLIERGARPQLTSSQWRAIQEEVASRTS